MPPEKPPAAARQMTLAEACSNRQAEPLTDNQRKVVSLIEAGLCQATIAERLKVSRSYVNQEIRKLLAFGLIQRIETHPDKEGKRNYTHFYEVTPYLKERMAAGGKEPFTATRMHYFRMKFKVIRQSGPPSKDERAEYNNHFFLRGKSERYIFWFKGKPGQPSVTLTIHPKTIVASVDKGQYIPARNGKEATELGWLAIYAARERFIELQHRFGIDFEIEQTGTVIGKPHAGFVFHEDWKLAQKDTDLPGWHIDKSPEKELGPGWMEIETDNKRQWTPLEQGIQQLSALPEAMKDLEKIGPLTSEVHSVLAHIQSGTNVQNQVNQLIIMFGKMLEQNHSIQQQQHEILLAISKAPAVR